MTRKYTFVYLLIFALYNQVYVVAESIDFESKILPILEERCFKCHADPAKRKGKHPRGGLRLDSPAFILQGGDNGAIIVNKDPEKSSLYFLAVLPPDDEDIMPAKGEPLTLEQTELIKHWILGGAHFGNWKGGDATAVDYVKRNTAPQLPHYLDLVADGLNAPYPKNIAAVQRTGARVTPVAPGHVLYRVEYISIEDEIDDNQIAKLEHLQGHITDLDISKTRVSDKGLESIRRLAALTRLDLHETSVGDRGLNAIVWLSELRYLNLYGTRVTDAGISRLKELEKLEELYLWNTRVTAAGIRRLREAMPNTQISF